MMTRDALREYARKNHVKGYGSLLKNELIHLLENYKQEKLPLEIPKPVPAVPTLGQELKKKVGGNGAGTCSYALEFGKHRRFQVRDICHGRLKSLAENYYARHPEEAKDCTAVALNVSGHLEQIAPDLKEDYKEFVRYTITESPYASVFLTKNINDAFSEAIYLDVNKSLSQCVAGAIALREGSEHRNWLSSFASFRKLGFSSKESWFLASFFRTGPDLTTFDFHFKAGGHMTIHGGMSWEHFVKFYNEGFHRVADAPLKTNKNHYSIFSHIANQDGEPCRIRITKEFPRIPFDVRGKYKMLEWVVSHLKK